MMSKYRIVVFGMVVGLLAACGTTTAERPTAPAAASQGATTAATVAASTSAPASAATAPASAATAAPAASAAVQPSYNGIPTSRTAEGYHVLGRADAPVTIEFFSDFL